VHYVRESRYEESTLTRPALTDTPGDCHSGLAAGTLLHAESGLVQVERLRVGDRVLSRAADGQSAPQYKRVIDIDWRDDCPLHFVQYEVEQPKGQPVGDRLIAAPGHLVWVEGSGWQVRSLKASMRGVLLSSIAERKTLVRANRKLYVSASPAVGWLPGHLLDDKGTFFDLEQGAFVMEAEQAHAKSAAFGVDLGRAPSRPKPADLLRARVYDIVVEDFHTCFIGPSGIWTAAGPNDRVLAQSSTARRRRTEPVSTPVDSQPLTAAEIKRAVIARLQDLLLPLGFRRDKDRARLGDRHFMFRRDTTVGPQHVSGFVSRLIGRHTLYIDCGVTGKPAASFPLARSLPRMPASTTKRSRRNGRHQATASQCRGMAGTVSAPRRRR